MVDFLMSRFAASHACPLEADVRVCFRVAAVRADARRGKDAHGEQGGEEVSRQKQGNSNGFADLWVHVSPLLSDSPFALIGVRRIAPSLSRLRYTGRNAHAPQTAASNRNPPSW